MIVAVVTHHFTNKTSSSTTMIVQAINMMTFSMHRHLHWNVRLHHVGRTLLMTTTTVEFNIWISIRIKWDLYLLIGTYWQQDYHQHQLHINIKRIVIALQKKIYFYSKREYVMFWTHILINYMGYVAQEIDPNKYMSHDICKCWLNVMGEQVVKRELIKIAPRTVYLKTRRYGELHF